MLCFGATGATFNLSALFISFFKNKSERQKCNMLHICHPRQKKEKSSADGDFETVSPASPLYCANAATASALSFIKQIKRSVLSPMRTDFVFLPLSQIVKPSSASAFINPFLEIENASSCSLHNLFTCLCAMSAFR